MKSCQSCHLHLLTPPCHMLDLFLWQVPPPQPTIQKICAQIETGISVSDNFLRLVFPASFTAYTSPKTSLYISHFPKISASLLIHPGAILSPAESSVALLLRGKWVGLEQIPVSAPCGFRSSQIFPSLTRFWAFLTFSNCFLSRQPVIPRNFLLKHPGLA